MTSSKGHAQDQSCVRAFEIREQTFVCVVEAPPQSDSFKTMRFRTVAESSGKCLDAKYAQSSVICPLYELQALFSSLMTAGRQKCFVMCNPPLSLPGRGRSCHVDLVSLCTRTETQRADLAGELVGHVGTLVFLSGALFVLQVQRHSFSRATCPVYYNPSICGHLIDTRCSVRASSSRTIHSTKYFI